jgi:hypothetical protein
MKSEQSNSFTTQKLTINNGNKVTPACGKDQITKVPSKQRLCA